MRVNYVTGSLPPDPRRDALVRALTGESTETKIPIGAPPNIQSGGPRTSSQGQRRQASWQGAPNNSLFSGGLFQRQGERPPEMTPENNSEGWNIQGGDTGIYQPQAVPPPDVADPYMQIPPQQLPTPDALPGGQATLPAWWHEWPQFSGGGFFNSGGSPFGGGPVG